MQLFLDSANLKEIKECLELGLVTGVTTNPSLMAKEKNDRDDGDLFTSYLEKMVDISLIISRSRSKIHLSVEALSLDPELIVEQSLLLKKSCSRDGVDLYVKVPFIKQTLPCLSQLYSYGVKTNLTALMSSRQGYMTSRYNPDIVSFFYNRMIDYFEKETKDNNKNRHVTDWDLDIFNYKTLHDARLNAHMEIKNYWDSYRKSGTQVICGSIRSTDDVESLWKISQNCSPGIIVTAPYKIVMEMITHSKTDEAVKKFTDDIEAWYNK